MTRAWFRLPIFAFASLATFAVAGGCASSAGPNYGSETPWVYEQSKASGAAYSSDSMTFSKQSQPRRPNTARQFYYKDCAHDDGRAYYSKTSYACADPW